MVGGNVKPEHEQDNEQVDYNINMKKENTYNFKLISVLLAIAGCYNGPSTTTRGNLLYRTIQVYQVIYILILLFSLWRNLDTLINFPGGYNVIVHITEMAYQILCVSNCLISWKAFSDKYGHQRKTVHFVNNTLVPLLEASNIRLDYKKFYRRQTLILTFGFVLIAMSFVVWVLGSYVTVPSPETLKASNITYNLSKPFKDSNLARLTILIPGLLLDTNLVAVSLYLIMVSFLMKSLLTAYNNHLKQQLTENKVKVTDNLEQLRAIHDKLSTTIQDFDNDLGYFYGNIFLWTLFLSVGVFYFIINDSLTFLVLVIQAYYLFLCLGFLFATSILAAVICEEAHKPLQFIYKMDINYMDTTKLAQLHMFLSRLTGTQIGFTTCGLLLITKEFVLSVAGAFLTYFAILYTL